MYLFCYKPLLDFKLLKDGLWIILGLGDIRILGVFVVLAFYGVYELYLWFFINIGIIRFFYRSCCYFVDRVGIFDI